MVSAGEEPSPVTLTFLGTGNFQANGRYWNSFVMDGNVLVEPSPTALPHLRKCGLHGSDLEVVVISHFHADHTFGWPFLLLEVMLQKVGQPLYIVGPPGVKQYLHEMTELGGIQNVQSEAHARINFDYVEVDGTWQQAGPLRFRGVEVEHVPHLRCFGYLFEKGDRNIGYSGDTRPCAGLDELAQHSEVLVLECDAQHLEAGLPRTHMNEDSVRELRSRFPATKFVLTHMGAGVDGAGIENIVVPQDFDRLAV